MGGESQVASRALGAILLAGLAFFCGYGFLASYEPGFPNVWQFSYDTAGVAALLGAAWLAIAAKAERGGGEYWRPFRLAALFSLFNVFAFTTGDLANLGFLFFLLFLLPITSRPGASP